MGEKLKGILGSLRFWLVTLTAALAIAEIVWGGTEVVRVLQAWLAAVVGIGTLDSVATKIGGNKS